MSWKLGLSLKYSLWSKEQRMTKGSKKPKRHLRHYNATCDRGSSTSKEAEMGRESIQVAKWWSTCQALIGPWVWVSELKMIWEKSFWDKNLKFDERYEYPYTCSTNHGEKNSVIHHGLSPHWTVKRQRQRHKFSTFLVKPAPRLRNQRGRLGCHMGTYVEYFKQG